MPAIQCSLVTRTEGRRNEKYTSSVHPHSGLPGSCTNNALLESEKRDYKGRIPSPVALL